MTISYKNGNKIIWNESEKDWFYENGMRDDKEKPCPKCGQYPENGIDWCLGKLPGVKNACCGHGVEQGYIQFKNGVILRFDNLIVEKKSE